LVFSKASLVIALIQGVPKQAVAPTLTTDVEDVTSLETVRDAKLVDDNSMLIFCRLLFRFTAWSNRSIRACVFVAEPECPRRCTLRRLELFFKNVTSMFADEGCILLISSLILTTFVFFCRAMATSLHSRAVNGKA